MPAAKLTAPELVRELRDIARWAKRSGAAALANVTEQAADYIERSHKAASDPASPDPEYAGEF